MRNSNLDAKGSEPPRRLRCAIYTRKSTEEGLEQEFSSLDAQREAAEAFILSQRREGWVALFAHYDGQPEIPPGSSRRAAGFSPGRTPSSSRAARQRRGVFTAATPDDTIPR
jgi:hypothetical protein